MPVSLEDVIAKAVIETFRDIAFIFADESAMDTRDNPMTRVEVVFRSPGSRLAGTLVLGYSESLILPLAVNMIGADGPGSVTAAECHDVLAEVSNVICGHVLPSLDSPITVWDIARPRVMPAGVVPALGNPKAHVVVPLELGMVEAMVGFGPMESGCDR